jgi:phage terminase large subunit
MRDRYFIAYVGTKNENPHMIIRRFQDLFQEMNANYCIVFTTEDDEVYIEEVDAAAFEEVKCQMN